jgi:xanthine dehydrogenase YagS FAD-binding subunit
VKAFRYERAKTVEAAVAASAAGGAVLKANGIDVLDRLKERIDEPDRVVTLIDVPGLDRIETIEGGGIRIGAMATLADLAASKLALPRALVAAASEAASPQLRNRATVGGNLCQHTRCGYYRVKTFDCLKRGVGGCPVLAPGGVQETNGIFGNGLCACAHPSSLAPVFGAIGAKVVVRGKSGERRISVAELYRPPVVGQASDTTLAPGDVITSIEISGQTPSRTAFYEVRQRASYDWALVSCAVAFDGGENIVKDGAGIWLGAVAPSPMRAVAAEKALIGKPFTEANATAAAEAAVVGATPLAGNAYKVDLVKVAVRRALMAAWEKH